jgi:hypothetical protein
MRWCQILIDDSGEDERTFKRRLSTIPTAGDVIEVDGQTVLVTSVSLIPPRAKGTENVSVLIYCRQH